MVDRWPADYCFVWQMLAGNVRMTGCVWWEINVFGIENGVGLNVLVSQSVSQSAGWSDSQAATQSHTRPNSLHTRKWASKQSNDQTL